MNMLFLAHRVPFPPDKGDKLRSYQFISHLAGAHRVWCAAFADDPRDMVHVGALQERCREVQLIPLDRKRAKFRAMRSLIAGRTFTEGFYLQAAPAMTRLIADWTRRVPFDVVFAFSSAMAPFGLQAPAPRRVLDLCDLDSAKWAAYAKRTHALGRWVYGCEGRRLSRRERHWIHAYDETILISAAEAGDLPEEARRKIRIVGNGVAIPDSIRAEQAGQTPVVGFVGVMDYFPNVDAIRWFVRRVWPTVRRHIPGCRLQIVGRNPVRGIMKLHGSSGIEVTGEVSEVGPYVQNLAVSIAPLRIARGIQNKVLEAMAFAKPVVLTPQAAAGLDLHDGRDAAIAADGDTFANRVIQLLSFPTLRHHMGAAARKFVADHHQWSPHLANLEAIVAG